MNAPKTSTSFQGSIKETGRKVPKRACNFWTIPGFRERIAAITSRLADPQSKEVVGAKKPALSF